MKYLLDTHIILWALVNDKRLNQEIKDIILDPNNIIYYSTVSAWEVEIKHLKDSRFILSAEQLCFLCDQNNLLNLTIQNKHIDELKNIMDNDHKDPFDLMLLAQAISENMTLITHDKKFSVHNSTNVMIV